MELAKVTHIVVYRAYRESPDKPLDCAMFSDVKEAMSFAGSHSRYCSAMELCKVDFKLTPEILKALLKPIIVVKQL